MFNQINTTDNKVANFAPVEGRYGYGEFNANHRKENNYRSSYLALNKVTGNAIVDLRIYSTAARSYACVWINDGNQMYTSGSGYAQGYGYDRESAGVQEAFTAAGFTLDANIAGVGQTAIIDALAAVCVHFGFTADSVLYYKAHA